MASPRDMTATELKAESDRIVALLGQYEAQIADLRAQLQPIRSELEKRTRPQPVPRVSDHAVMRFMERVLGIDVQSFRDRILTDAVKSAIISGATAITVEGIRMTIANNTVVTVLDKSPPKRLQRDRSDVPRDDEFAEI